MKVLTDNYYKLTHLDFKALCPHLVTARIISHEDSRVVLDTTESSKRASHVLEKIFESLRGNVDAKFDDFLSILENFCNDSFCIGLAKQLRSDLLKRASGKSKIR